MTTDEWSLPAHGWTVRPLHRFEYTTAGGLRSCTWNGEAWVMDERLTRDGAKESQADSVGAVGGAREAESDGALLERLGCDGREWAREFIQTIDRIGRDKIDEALMTAWFANAIEHSGDVLRWRREKAAAACKSLEARLVELQTYSAEMAQTNGRLAADVRGAYARNAALHEQVERLSKEVAGAHGGAVTCRFQGAVVPVVPPGSALAADMRAYQLTDGGADKQASAGETAPWRAPPPETFRDWFLRKNGQHFDSPRINDHLTLRGIADYLDEQAKAT